MKSLRVLREGLQAPLLAVAAGFLINTLILMLAGEDVLSAYSELWRGAFGDIYGIATTLRWATPLMLTGLAAGLAFRSGLYNIGGDGQFYVGAFAAAWVGFSFTALPGWLMVLLAMLVSALAGALWGSVPGFLRAATGTDEVITSLMMGYIGMLFTEYLVRYPFQAPGSAGQSGATVNIAPQAMLSTLIPGTQVTTALIIGLAVAMAVWYLMKQTTAGYEWRMLGLNPEFAHYGGIRIGRAQVAIMMLSGAMAGLAGMTEVLGVQHRFITHIATSMGMDGVVVAILGRNHPVGIVLGALLMGALKAGAVSMERFSNVPRSMVMVLQGIVVVTITVQGLSQWRARRKGGQARAQ